jgi:hypothetical protein
MSDEPTPTSMEDKQAFARALFGGQPDPEPAVTDVTPPPTATAEDEAPAVTNVTPPDPAAAHNQLIAKLLGGKAA